MADAGKKCRPLRLGHLPVSQIASEVEAFHHAWGYWVVRQRGHAEAIKIAATVSSLRVIAAARSRHERQSMTRLESLHPNRQDANGIYPDAAFAPLLMPPTWAPLPDAVVVIFAAAYLISAATGAGCDTSA